MRWGIVGYRVVEFTLYSLSSPDLRTASGARLNLGVLLPQHSEGDCGAEVELICLLPPAEETGIPPLDEKRADVQF